MPGYISRGDHEALGGLYYKYRGYTLYKFDGYYDVHAGNYPTNPQPIAEGFNTAKEAKAFVDDLKIDDALINGRFTIRNTKAAK